MADGGSYTDAGVDYDVLDAGKRLAIQASLATSGYGSARGVEADDRSRGESAFVFRVGPQRLAMVIECLGTKSSIADEYERACGVNRFDWIGYDSVAAITNDLCSVGALPAAVNAYFATGSASWYSSPERFSALVAGWQRGCQDSGAAWGGGESPMLGGIIAEQQIDLAGSAVGYLPDGTSPLYGDDLAPGDDIVLVASSGLQTNGASLARAAARKAGGFGATLADGTSFGDAVLTPSLIYVPLIESLLARQADLKYVSHITGHGFRKLMRASRQLTYRITELPPVLPVFAFMCEILGLGSRTAYGTFNMGAGLAIYCSPGSSADVVDAAAALGFSARICGTVEAGPRRVILEPAGVEFGDDDLSLR